MYINRCITREKLFYYYSLFPVSSWTCPLDLEICDDALTCSLETVIILPSLALWLFNSTQFSGLGDRSLDIGGGEGVHPSSLRTDNFSSGVFKGGKLSAVSRMSLILAVTERSSGWSRPSGDGGSSTTSAAASCVPSSKQYFAYIDLMHAAGSSWSRWRRRRSGRFVRVNCIFHIKNKIKAERRDFQRYNLWKL